MEVRCPKRHCHAQLGWAGTGPLLCACRCDLRLERGSSGLTEAHSHETPAFDYQVIVGIMVLVAWWPSSPSAPLRYIDMTKYEGEEPIF